MKFNSIKLTKSAYDNLKKISSNIKKKFNSNISIKGNKSEFDSVDVVTFFSLLEKEIKKQKLKNPNFLDENFFFKYEKIDIKKIQNLMNKQNEKRN